MAELLPPPIYSQEDPDNGPILQPEQSGQPEILPVPQMLIIPTIDTLNFQKGFLGAEGERAAIEGELQIKGAATGQWDKL